MADIFSMLAQARTPQEQALAQEIIRSMIGTAARPVDNGQPIPQRDPMAQAQAEWTASQISDPQWLAQQMLVAAGQSQMPPKPQVVNNRNPLQQAIAEVAGQNLDAIAPKSVEEARARLGGAATPVRATSGAENRTMLNQADSQLRSQGLPAAGDIPTVAQSGSLDLGSVLQEFLASEADSRTAAILNATVPLEQNKPVFSDSKDPVERVNANSSIFGVTAKRDKSGRITLSNMDETTGQPTAASQTFYGDRAKVDTEFNPMNSGMSNTVSKLMEDIRSAPDVATASGIADQLRTSITEQRVRMEQDAYKQAEAELGLEAARRGLAAARTTQASTIGWTPAMGDLPAVSKLASQIADKERLAKQRAEDWLQRNISYRQLDTMNKNAESAITLATTKSLAGEQRAAAKEAQLDAEFNSIPPQVRMVAARLNKDLVNATPAALVAFVKRESKNKDFVDLAEADPMEYSQLAFGGNKLARDMLIQDESARTGLNSTFLQQEFSAFEKEPVTDQQIEAYVASSISGARTKEATAQARAALLGDPLAPTKERMAKRADVEARVRQMRLKEARENRLIGDILSWAPDGSAIQQSAKKVASISGKADLQGVLADMTRDKPLEEQAAIIRSVRESISAQGTKYLQSSYGKIDSGKVMAAFNNTINELGFLQMAALERVRAVFGGNVQSQFQDFSALRDSMLYTKGVE